MDGPSSWIKKSHYPIVFPFQRGSEHDIAIICTRYELDVEPSFFLLFFTTTHVMTFKNKFLEDPIYPTWLESQKHFMHMYGNWHRYWIKMAEETEKPIYFFRFEDVL